MQVKSHVAPSNGWGMGMGGVVGNDSGIESSLKGNMWRQEESISI